MSYQAKVYNEAVAALRSLLPLDVVLDGQGFTATIFVIGADSTSLVAYNHATGVQTSVENFGMITAPGFDPGRPIAFPQHPTVM